ncbi:MAG: SRPBCC family protein [Flammeovirgaceae bacterium]
MKANISGSVAITINASRAKVWMALTEPAQIKQYLFGTDTHTTWQVGTPIRFTGEWEGKKYEDKGTILNFEKENMLQYDYWSNMSGTEDHPDNYVVITYLLEDAEEGVRLTIKHDNYRTEEARVQSEQNWGTVMDAIKQLLEQNN